MKNAAVLNAGSGAWAFEGLAKSLASAFGVRVVTKPAKFNFVLAWDGEPLPVSQSFVPWQGIEYANDKRLSARAFEGFCVPRPATYLLSDEQLTSFLERERARQWVLKYPTGSGGTGHRFIHAGDTIPDDWPRPLLVQEFIEMARPEVFRFYGVAGVLFGWNVRRYSPDATVPSPFVAHARGARYEQAGLAPPRAVRCARRALEATELWGSWGCADLMQDSKGRWLALEVGTDGIWNHVDREIGLPNIESELETRLTKAFKAWSQTAQ